MSQNNTRFIFITVWVCSILMLVGCGRDLTDSSFQTVTAQIEASPRVSNESEDPQKPEKTDTIPSTTASILPTPDQRSASPTAQPSEPGQNHDGQTDFPSDAIRVDHHSVELFEKIPEEFVQRASQLHMLFMDRSVGVNIDEGLTCLGYPSSALSPIGCRRDQHKVPAYNVPSNELNWSSPGGYYRGNWVFHSWPMPGCNSWADKVDCFIEYIEPRMDQFDVVSFQYSYLAVNEGSTIEDIPGGFLWDTEDLSNVYDLEAFEDRHPEKRVIYWTTSLARSIGTEESQTFNQQMREYALENGKILFDVADILSHDPYGESCFDNRDGVPYDDGNKSEDFPDDGREIPAICQHYTTEPMGGHLGSIAVGKIRVAKAFWVLMARIAGWVPDG